MVVLDHYFLNPQTANQNLILWFMPIIVATQKAKMRRSWFETSQGKKFERPYLKKNLHIKGLVEWLKV
jgi:hypothetical protein